MRFIKLANEWQSYRHGNAEYREDRREGNAGNTKVLRNWGKENAKARQDDGARQKHDDNTSCNNGVCILSA